MKHRAETACETQQGTLRKTEHKRRRHARDVMRDRAGDAKRDKTEMPQHMGPKRHACQTGVPAPSCDTERRRRARRTRDAVRNRDATRDRTVTPCGTRRRCHNTRKRHASRNGDATPNGAKRARETGRGHCVLKPCEAERGRRPKNERQAHRDPSRARRIPRHPRIARRAINKGNGITAREARRTKKKSWEARPTRGSTPSEWQIPPTSGMEYTTKIGQERMNSTNNSQRKA